VIAGDRVFLTASEGKKLITMCLDRSSGQVLWRREIVRPRATPVYKLNDPASPSPVTDGRNVYAFFPDLGLVSFGPDGNERWRVPLGPFDTFYGLGGSPVLAGDMLLLICDARTKPFMIAVEAGTGKIRWRRERSEVRFEGYASPVVWEPKGEPPQIIVLGANRVDAYTLATGAPTWWVRGLAYFPIGSPVFAKNLVVVSTWGSDAPIGPSYDEWLKKDDSNGDGRISREESSTNKDVADVFGGLDKNNSGFIERGEWEDLRNGAVGDHGMVAVRLGGTGDLTKNIAWRNRKNHSNIPSALVYKDVLYTVKSGGIISSIDPLTGKVFKTGRSKDAIDEYYSSPVAADDKVIFTSEKGKVSVIKAGRQWEVLAVNDLGEECYATPAIAGGNILIRTRAALYCFRKK
jgi:outer membrane protein assembly factor BamB